MAYAAAGAGDEDHASGVRAGRGSVGSRVGAEIGWDLDRASGPSAADRNFLHYQLHAALNGDANDDSGVYSFTPATASFFAGNPAGAFDDGGHGIYWVGYPDSLTPSGQGASAAMNYPGFSSGAAANVYDGSAGGGKVVYFGFPFETITSATARLIYMSDILKYFSRPVRIEEILLTAQSQPRLRFTGEPGLTYTLETSPDLLNWTTVANLRSESGSFEYLGPAPGGARKFYRTRLDF